MSDKTVTNEKISQYLAKINKVIEAGKYKNTWASLSEYGEAKWYKNAKFGIFIHWGVYSVPAFGSEWYPRFMYIKGTPEYEHHLKTYGPHKDFGYKDFIPQFKAEHFDPKEWAQLFKETGAKFVMPVAEHHDGFQMYDSELSRWNAAQMGPCRDVVGELKTELEKEGLVFTASSHRAENFWYFAGAGQEDSGITAMEYQEPYGYAHPEYATHGDHIHEKTHDIDSVPATKEHLEDWLVRTCELVDKYQPKIVWFDWWIHNRGFKEYLKKFAAYYYNRSIEWGHEVAINYKYDAYALGSGVYDIERGQLSAIRPRFWQNDTAVAKNSWGYTENNDFKKSEELVCDLIDICSKNGALLLNVGPKADGTITAEDRAVLKGIGDWLQVNGEAIYDTTYWHVFGEGPTEVPDGAFTDVNRASYCSEDIRFTWKAPYVYAHVLSWPTEGKITIKSMGLHDTKLGNGLGNQFMGHIENVELLRFDNSIDFSRDLNGLHIIVKGEIKTEYPVCLKVLID